MKGVAKRFEVSEVMVEGSIMLSIKLLPFGHVGHSQRKDSIGRERNVNAFPSSEFDGQVGENVTVLVICQKEVTSLRGRVQTWCLLESTT